jgi:hypothetical protein
MEEEFRVLLSILVKPREDLVPIALQLPET